MSSNIFSVRQLYHYFQLEIFIIAHDSRFQINSTTPRQVQLVKKAAYTVMAMLSLLGDRSLPHVVQGSDNR